jgi:hypothetical protein
MQGQVWRTLRRRGVLIAALLYIVVAVLSLSNVHVRLLDIALVATIVAAFVAVEVDAWRTRR